jgi:hypothetical protein
LSVISLRCRADSDPANTAAKLPRPMRCHVFLKESLRRIGGVPGRRPAETRSSPWIHGREPGHHVPAKQCLITVGGDLSAVWNENDQTLFAIAAAKDHNLRWSLREGLIQIFSSTSDTSRPVRYLLFRRLIRASVTKSFLSEKMRTLPESSPLSLRNNCLALSWRLWSGPVFLE